MSHEQESFTESLRLLSGRNIQLCKLSSLPSERGTVSGYTISFPFPCSDQKANMVAERTIGCARFISSAISLKSHLSFISSHIKLTQQKDCVAAQGTWKTRNTEPFPLKGWHDTKASRPSTLPQRHCHSSTYFLSEGFSLLCAIYSVF